MFVIGLSGKARSGKNTVGMMLCMLADLDGFAFSSFSFAKKLKERAVRYGWDGEKNDVGRFILQTIGTRFREKQRDYWIQCLEESGDLIPKPSVIRFESRIDSAGHTAINYVNLGGDLSIITDVRYRNEAEWIKNKMHGEVWRVERLYGKDIPADFPVGTGSYDWTKHASETELDDWKYDFRISAPSGDFSKLLERTEEGYKRITEKLLSGSQDGSA